MILARTFPVGHRSGSQAQWALESNWSQVNYSMRRAWSRNEAPADRSGSATLFGAQAWRNGIHGSLTTDSDLFRWKPAPLGTHHHRMRYSFTACSAKLYTPPR